MPLSKGSRKHDFRFLSDLLGRPGGVRTVILLEADAMAAPRQYEVRPIRLIVLSAAVTAAVALLLAAALLWAPLPPAAGGTGGDQLRATAAENARRAAALEDSVAVQYQQIARLRALITGEADASPESPIAFDSALAARGSAASEPGPAPAADAGPPAGEDVGLPARSLGPSTTGEDPAQAYLDRLRLPAPAPVVGVLSRPFDAAAGHFGLDIAARTGTPVRALGSGHVVFADWTDGGGFTIAVQYPGGYLGVYKHNQRLLKRAGDRVRGQEPIALSGNTGTITTGPHLHFELWRDGLARDPRAYLASP